MTDSHVLLAGLGASLVLNALLLFFLARAEQRLIRLRSRRAEIHGPAARIAARAERAEAPQDARPVAGTAFLNSAPPPAASQGVLLAKKPTTRKGPVLPKDIAQDYQARRTEA
ncbi:MAG: hypothetical protein Tsb0016_24200 [Sphingomonadales bacterium]